MRKGFLSIEAVLTVAVAISATLNVALIWRVKALDRMVVTIKEEGKLGLGSVVPPLEIKAFGGSATKISPGDSQLPIVLYVFSPECGWCKKNERNVNALFEHSKDKYRFIALSLVADGLDSYLRKYTVSRPVYYEPSYSTLAAYKFSGTPQTIVIAQDGRVIKNWSGAYVREIQHEIEGFFGLKMPGLLEN
jgi:hypothetical protein